MARESGSPRVSIKAERKRLGLSREQLASAACLSYSTIVYVERFGVLTRRTAEHVARVFECEPDEVAP